MSEKQSGRAMSRDNIWARVKHKFACSGLEILNPNRILGSTTRTKHVIVNQRTFDLIQYKVI